MILELKPFNYDIAADFYDTLELDESLNKVIVENLIEILRKNNCLTVWDAACGTGAQSIPLAKAGFKVTASDICSSMIRHAKMKSAAGQEFCKGDMRNFDPGQVDAVIVMMNSLGHLSEPGTEETFRNFSHKLNAGGILVGDVDNRKFLETKLTDQDFISRVKFIEDDKFMRKTKAVKVGEGVYEVCDLWFSEQCEIFEGTCEIQSWYLEDLQKVLEKSGFRVLNWYSRRFKALEEVKGGPSDSLLFVAEKI